ncbi:hypothetical protein [Shinella zoogloeoides]|uniref:Uncharacterized protein n=1 Tax=Shinella zoogloeoides TaxID=352475 RepID=A0A6N8TNP3_SHIZO|nr:hypothetical protein [Shinella zoogloeoides]MXO02868.1 hypothetical protein [Shinella zoogloeoides]UEX83111.1 hypothetical protein K8M09_07530 [Shinella zoogloeoides]
MARRAAVFFAFFSISAPSYAASICIDGSYIFTGDVRSIEIYDNVCNKTVGTFDVIGGSKRTGIPVCLNGDNASVNYRNVTTNSPVTRKDWLKNGDCITP